MSPSLSLPIRIIQDPTSAASRATAAVALGEMATTQDERPTLLSMPTELLQQIAVFVEDDAESMHNFRLACRTFDTATFDQYATKHFQFRRYCVYYKSSWLRLKDFIENAARMAIRLRCVTFTTSILEKTDWQDMHIVEKREQADHRSAQYGASLIYDSPESKAMHCGQLPDTELMRCVLNNLKMKHPHVVAELDFLSNVEPWLPPIHHDVLMAFICTGSAVYALKCGAYSTHNLKELEGTLQSDLLASCSSIRDFSFFNFYFDRKPTDAVDIERCEILESILRASRKSLRRLAIGFIGCQNHIDAEEFSAKLLMATLNTKLRALNLTVVPVTDIMLLRALTRWKSRLAVVTLCAVELQHAGGGGWYRVFETLASMPALQFLLLHRLSIGVAPHIRGYVDLRHLIRGKMLLPEDRDNPRRIIVHYQYRDEVIAVLEQLLDGSLTYC